MDILLPKLTIISWVPNRFTHPSDGFGSHLANKNTRSSFGSSYKIGSTRGGFSEEKTCTWILIYVS
jgi:hypothetical protein